MNIRFCPTIQYTPSFSSKSEEIRKADNIQRNTRTAFPFFSPKYADDYYLSCSIYPIKHNPKDAYEYMDNIYRLEKQSIKLNFIRENRAENLCGRNNFFNKLQETLRDIKKYKLANCEEASTMVLANLLANGYKNSFKCSLKLETRIFEKNSKEYKYSVKDSLDHALVISTMDKNPENKGKYFVLDSWYGFADSISGANSRYKQLTDKKKWEKSKQKAINQFINLYQNKYKNFDINDFEIRQRIVYDIKEFPNNQDREKLAQFFKSNYPELILE